jgi:hypothetical protein
VQFHGFFAVAPVELVPGILAAATSRWPLGRGRTIEQPFVGLGFRMPEPGRIGYETDIDFDRTALAIFAVQDQLPHFSGGWPAVPFVWLHADFIGEPLVLGYVAMAGRVLGREEDEHRGEGRALAALVANLGVELGGEGFAPLAEGFFHA